MNKVILVDGKNAAYRSHFTHWRLSSRGRPTSVIFGMTHMLMGVHHRLKAPMIIVWDGAGKTWRHKITASREKVYKGNRNHLSGVRNVVNTQIPTIQNFYSNIGIWNFEVFQLEADDLIGILATHLKKDHQVIIYSGDRDYYQLLDKNVTICNGQGKGKKKNEILTAESVEAEWGISVKDWTKMRAFCGDHSDNIAHVKKGIGAKTAIKLVKAGLDPKFKFFNRLKDEVQEKYAEEFESIWPMAHENYWLSRIITSYKDEKLPPEIKQSVKSILDKISENGITRNREYVNLYSYRYFLEFLVNYEMEELFNLRGELWGFL